MIEKEIFRAVYNTLVKYLPRKMQGADWESLIKEMGEITNKYECQLCSDMIVAVYTHLEKQNEK